jgi:hypothetical protein
MLGREMRMDAWRRLFRLTPVCPTADPQREGEVDQDDFKAFGLCMGGEKQSPGW